MSDEDDDWLVSRRDEDFPELGRERAERSQGFRPSSQFAQQPPRGIMQAAPRGVLSVDPSPPQQQQQIVAPKLLMRPKDAPSFDKKSEPAPAPKSLKEKEAEYAAVRARIFGEDGGNGRNGRNGRGNTAREQSYAGSYNGAYNNASYNGSYNGSYTGSYHASYNTAYNSNSYGANGGYGGYASNGSSGRKQKGGREKEVAGGGASAGQKPSGGGGRERSSVSAEEDPDYRRDRALFMPRYDPTSARDDDDLEYRRGAAQYIAPTYDSEFPTL
eukprot:TRINITY_DN123113_c0_g1_i1.p1 TRINITY_DN123113_c0_g1~~TRINITY_DN123113_c0_g1_i1.p1  ORF type:complete len:272 (+),score=49.51 TRINITY_DN123113_c0_g1_i1:97-912(+)